MDAKKTVGLGVAGAVVASTVCFSPLVVAALAAAGLGSWFGWIDSAFHLVLLGSVVLLGYGLYRLRRRRASTAGGGDL